MGEPERNGSWVRMRFGALFLYLMLTSFMGAAWFQLFDRLWNAAVR